MDIRGKFLGTGNVGWVCDEEIYGRFEVRKFGSGIAVDDCYTVPVAFIICGGQGVRGFVAFYCPHASSRFFSCDRDGDSA